MKYQKVLSRRTLLRGAGTVAIGLPFLSAMSSSSVLADPAPGEIPERCVTLFFGLGVPKTLQREGLDDDRSPLAPLRPHRDKISILTDVGMSAPDALLAPHLWGGLMSLTGARPRNTELAGGPSIDQVVKRHAYPSGVPTRLDTLAAGFFLDRLGWEHYRSRDAFGAPAAAPLNQPVALFEHVFGTPPGAGADAREQRIRRSVLDGTLAQYRHYVQDRGDVGGENRVRLEQHLDQIRQLERRVYGAIPASCAATPAPAQPELPYDVDGALHGHEVTVATAQEVFATLTEIFVIALRCDLVRFGSLMFEPPAAHTRFLGRYRWGSYEHDFDGTTSHHDYHGSDLVRMRAYSHLAISQVAAALSALDDPAFPGPSGGSLLDETAVLLATEVGTNHDHDGVLHAVAGGCGRLQLGRVIDAPVHAVDVYRTFVRALGVDAAVGEADLFTGEIDDLRAA